ncbi:hypothetical protein ACQ4WX_25230 [Streptomyces lasalocidi]
MTAGLTGPRARRTQKVAGRAEAAPPPVVEHDTAFERAGDPGSGPGDGVRREPGGRPWTAVDGPGQR